MTSCCEQLSSRLRRLQTDGAKRPSDLQGWIDSSRVCDSGCFKGLSKSVQVLFNNIEAFMVLTLIILKWRALSRPG